jgi:hypothetical protein
MHPTNVSEPNFIEYTLKDLKAHIDSNSVIVGDFITPLSPIDRILRQKNQQRDPRTK